MKKHACAIHKQNTAKSMHKKQTLFSKYIPTWLSENALLLSLTSLLNDISSEMIFPILPIYITQILGAPPAILGIIEGVASGTEHSVRGISGIISDRMPKRRPLISIGYAISAITKPLFSIATGWPVALLIRSADRAGKGLRVVPRDAFLATDSAGTNLGKIMGFRKAADNFGAVVGPLVCIALLALFAYFGLNNSEAYRLVFFISVFPAIFGLALVLKIKEPIRIPKAPNLRTVLLPPPGKWRNFLLLCAFFSLGMISWAFFVLRATDIGIAYFVIPLFYVLANFVGMMTSTYIGEIIDRIGAKTVLGLSFATFGFVCFLFLIVNEPIILGFAFAVYGLFLGSYETSIRVYVATHFPNDEMGSRLGSFYWITALCAVPSGFITGVVYPMQWNGWSFAFIWGLIISLISSFLLFATRHKRLVEKAPDNRIL